MSGLEVKMSAKFRDEKGRFVSRMEEAAMRTIQDIVDEAAAAGRAVAPTGAKKDPRSKSIKASMKGEALSGHTGRVINTARHAAALYHGTKAHPQTGKVNFFWEEQGRPWYPNKYAEELKAYDAFPGTDVINHPATAAQPAFMDVAYQYMVRNFAEIAKRHYPGG